jgi:hypothetical protein
MSYYPLQVREFSPPTLDWPGICDQWGTPRLVLIAPDASTPWGALQLAPQGEPVEGDPPEGEILTPGQSPLVPVWVMEPQPGFWWAVDGTSGQPCGGVLPVQRRAALGQLAFCFGAALMMAFLGSSVVFALLSMLGTTLPLVVGQGVGGRAICFLVGATLVLALTWRLHRVFPSLLAEPVERVQSGRLSLPPQEGWLGLMQGASTLMALLAGLGLLGCLAATWSSQSSLLTLVLLIAHTVLAGALAVKCRELSKGKPFLTSFRTIPPGALGDLVRLGLRVAIFAIAGQLTGGLLATTGIIPRFDAAAIALQGSQLGALMAVATSRLSRRDRSLLLAGLAGRWVGEALMGDWLALLLAFLAVAAPGILAALGLPAQEKKPAFIKAFRESWAFSLGMVVGRIVGRTLGVFFLGMGGLAVGETLAEQVAGSAALLSAATDRESSEASPKPI